MGRGALRRAGGGKALTGARDQELLFAYGSEEGSAAYVGIERIIGSVDGRTGSFVLHHSASGSQRREEGFAHWSVVPDSGTGELRGLRGEATIDIEPDGGHTFELDYDFE